MFDFTPEFGDKMVGLLCAFSAGVIFALIMTGNI
jgi:hypothetical protein